MPNIRDFAMMIIGNELTKIEPTLSLGSSDEMLLELCYKDYIEYYRWLTCNTLQVASDRPDKNDNGLAEEIIVEGSIDDMVTAIITFVRMWWKKYKERVKLIFETPKSDVLSMKGKGVMGSLLSIQEKEEILATITDTFIQNGEVCMPRLLAENLLLRTLGQSEKPFWNPQDKINLMTTLKREAKSISYIHGVLMFIKPNKAHWLREWRNEGNNQIV